MTRYSAWTVTSERRLEGTLESIDCVAGKGVTFQIRSGADLVGVMSPDLTSVQYIAYRTDLKGSIVCGPVNPGLPVYVTWRPGADQKTKVAVAIEYLAKRQAPTEPSPEAYPAHPAFLAYQAYPAYLAYPAYPALTPAA